MATDKKFVVKNGLQAQNIDFVDTTTATPTATLTASMSAAGVLSFDSGTLEIDGANNTVNIPLLGGTLGTNGNLIQFGDSASATDDRLQFGADQDLQIYHDGSHSYIAESGTGELRLVSTGGGIHFQDGSGNDVFEVFLAGQTHLHHNTTRRLSTISTGIEINGSDIVFEGATADAFETTLTVTDPTADRTITLPDQSGTVLLDSLSNQTVSSTFTVQGNSSLTYPSYTTILQVENTGSGTTALVLANDTTTERVTLFNVNGDFVIQNGLSEKGFVFSNGESITFEGSSIDANETTLTVTNPTADRTITLPDATGTVALTSDIPSLSGYLQNVVEDTTPQLGGGLDLNSNDITGTGDISITGNFTSSAAGTPEMLIQSTAASSQDAKLRIRGSRTTAISGDIAQIIFETNDTGTGTLSDVLASITAGKDTASTNQGQILFSTTDTNGGSPSEKLRIKSTGYTLLQGIGETSAQENAHLRVNDLTSWAQGVGGTLQLSGKHGSDGVNYVFGTIKGIKENATDNNHNSALTFSTRQQGGAPAEKMRISSDGNVGIGTETPQSTSKLHVNKTLPTGTLHYDGFSTVIVTDTEARLQLMSTDGGTNASTFLLSNGTKHWGLHHHGPTGSNVFSIGYRTSAATGEDITNNLSDVFNITTGGNVGIGTSSPSGRLHAVDGRNEFNFIQSSDNAYAIIKAGYNTKNSILNFENTSDAGYGRIDYDHATEYMAFSTNSSERMRISSGGVVAIGNISPKTWSGNSQGVLQIGNTGAIELYNTTDDPFSILSNLYRGTDLNYKYIENNEAARISFYEGDINFATAPTGTADTNATITTRLKIENGGNVGIGTDSPNTALEVKQTSGTATIRVHADHTSSPRSAIEFVRGTTDTFGGDAYTDWKIGQVGAGSQADFAIISNDTTRGSNERLTLEYDTGNVGIGDSAPVSTLEISKSDQTNGTTLTITNAFNGSTWAVDDIIGTVDFRTDDASTTEPTRGRIQSITDDVAGTNWSYGTALTFSTAFNNTLSEAMRISSGSKVGIGTINPNTQLSVEAFGATGGDNTRVFELRNQSATAYTADALTSYNLNTSYDIVNGATLTYHARGGDAGNIMTHSAGINSEPVVTERIVRLATQNTGTALYNRTYFAWDGAGTAAIDSSVASTQLLETISATGQTGSRYGLYANGDVFYTGVLTLGQADTASAHINAYENMTFNIDTDNDDAGTRYFAWYTNGGAGSGTELMRIEEGGNVGIGVDPSKKLHVGAGSVLIDNFSGSVGHMTINNATNNINNDYIRANIMMTRDEDQVVWNPSTNVWDFAGGASTDWSMIAHHSDSLRFYTGAAQATATTKNMTTFRTDHLAMSIQTDGLVGIGTNSPDGQLHVLGGVTKLEVQNVPNGVTASNASTLIEATEAQLQIMAVDTGSWASNITLTNAPASGTNRHWTIHHTPTTHPTAPESLAFRYTETNTVGQIGGDGSGATSETKMIISDGGDVGIGLDNPSYRLQVEGGNVSFNNGGADTLLNLETDASGTYDVKFNMGSGQNGIATEGHQIWYDNSTGDTHFNNTWTGGSIRFHTATATDKVATGTNERMTIDQNGTTTVQGVDDATLWLKGPPGTGGSDNEFRLISWGNPGTGPSQSLQQYSNGSIIHSYGETIDSVASSNLDFYAGGNGQISFRSPVRISSSSSLNFEGATEDANETTLAVTDPTADRTITLPDATGTVVLDSTEAATIYSYVQIFG